MAKVVRPGKHTFTIIEYGLIVGLFGFLIIAAFLLVGPGQRSAEERDAQRQVAVQKIARALVVKREFDRTPYLGRESAMAMLLASSYVQVIVTDDTGVVCNDPEKAPKCGAYRLDASGPNTRCVANLSGLVPVYIDKIPVDPIGSAYQESGLPIGEKNTGYYIRLLPGGGAEVGSCNAEVNVAPALP